MEKLKLAAHRGYAAAYPENSLEALRSAIDLGCRFVELDVQLSCDFEPVIIHDDNLLRCGGVDLSVLETPWEQLQQHSIGEPDRFGDRFADCMLQPLTALVTLLQAHPAVCAFVEIKDESLTRFGTDFTVARVLDVLSEVLSQVVIISFDSGVVTSARDMRGVKTGWVLYKHDADAQALATELKPDFLICNEKKIEDPPAGLWPGPWSWFLYEINDPDIALAWHARGVTMVEGMNIAALLDDERLKPDA